MTADKYPATSDRRRFVKGVVGSGVLAGVGTTASGVLSTTTNPTGEGGGRTEYVGIENTAGPAPRAMPMIPVAVDDRGYLKGVFPEWETREVDNEEVHVAETELAGVTYSPRWFQYCGVQAAPGLQPENDDVDEYFRYASRSQYDWQRTEVEPGEKVHVEQFADYRTWGNDVGADGIGKPAKVTWRSKDAGEGEMIAQVLRIPPGRFDRMRAETAHPDWLDAASAEGFVAWLDKCTHYCCVPSFKGTTQSAQFDAADRVYCSCHQSVYDPFSPVKRSFVALPRQGG